MRGVMNEAAAFHEAISSHLDDDGPRLLYADWLEERGDPRGEFIRVQCALARTDAKRSPREQIDLEERQRNLLKAYSDLWLAALEPFGVWHIEWRRGFAEEFKVDASRASYELAALLDAAPAVRVLRLSKAGSALRQLAESPELARISGIAMRYNDVGEQQIAPLVRSPFIGGLRSLDLRGCNLGEGGARVLAAASGLALEDLNLWGNFIGDEGAVTLSSASWLPGLKRLDLGCNRIGTSGGRALLRAEGLEGIEQLGLESNSLHHKTAKGLRDRFKRRLDLTRQVSVENRGVLMSPESIPPQDESES